MFVDETNRYVPGVKDEEEAGKILAKVARVTLQSGKPGAALVLYHEALDLLPRGTEEYLGCLAGVTMCGVKQFEMEKKQADGL